MGTALLVVGGLIMLVFGVLLLIQAFNKSAMWGLGYLFVPFVSLIFVIKFWPETKKNFLRMLIGLPFYIAGIYMAAGDLTAAMEAGGTPVP
jgi:uncharacterized membrane protein HdeD (DUF308 family)